MIQACTASVCSVKMLLHKYSIPTTVNLATSASSLKVVTYVVTGEQELVKYVNTPDGIKWISSLIRVKCTQRPLVFMSGQIFSGLYLLPYEFSTYISRRIITFTNCTTNFIQSSVTSLVCNIIDASIVHYTAYTLPQSATYNIDLAIQLK